jgi:hypothetical protein
MLQSDMTSSIGLKMSPMTDLQSLSEAQVRHFDHQALQIYLVSIIACLHFST